MAQQLVAKTNGDFVPERRLQAERRAGHKRKHRWTKSHMPDGLLYIGDEKPIAIELEISLKERSRLREIILDYALSSSIREIWYFVTNGTVRRAIERATKNDDDFRIFTIDLSRKRLPDDFPANSSDSSKGDDGWAPSNGASPGLVSSLSQ